VTAAILQEHKMSRKYNRQSRRETAKPRSQKSGSSRPTEFNPDYTPIIKDLRRIGVLAGTFIGILVVLSFFLR
jgi:hypothetical protein